MWKKRLVYEFVKRWQRQLQTPMIITFISKVFGFACYMIVRYFGGGMEVDVYLYALSIPSLVFASIGASVYTILYSA